jgi:hypothetical protein
VTEGESDFYESRAPQRIICHSKGPHMLRSNDSNPSPFCIIKLTIQHKHNPILVEVDNPSRNLQLPICQVIVIIEILRVMSSFVFIWIQSSVIGECTCQGCNRFIERYVNDWPLINFDHPVLSGMEGDECKECDIAILITIFLFSSLKTDY